MLRKRQYTPSETHLALHPPSVMIKCSCGVSFTSRPETEEDDPDKCLSCNRRGWSVLFPAQEEKPKTQVVPIRGRRGQNPA